MGCQGVSSHPRSGAAGPAWLLPSNKLYHSPDPFHHLLTYLLLANIHPQTCPYSANSQVTGNPHPKPAPAESRVTCVPPHPTSRDERGTSCFLRQGRLLAEQQEQGKVKSNTGTRKHLTQQNCRQLQTTGAVCSTDSSQAALCRAAQRKLNTK